MRMLHMGILWKLAIDSTSYDSKHYQDLLAGKALPSVNSLLFHVPIVNIYHASPKCLKKGSGEVTL